MPLLYDGVNMWSKLQISCFQSRDFSASGSKFSDSIFSLWAACLLFGISTPVMFGAVHCPSYSRLGETESCVASELSDDREEETASPPSSHPPPRVCFPLPFSPSHCAEIQPEEVSVSMYLFVFCMFAWVIVRICGCLCTCTAVLRSCQVDRKRGNFKSPF